MASPESGDFFDASTDCMSQSGICAKFFGEPDANACVSRCEFDDMADVVAIEFTEFDLDILRKPGPGEVENG